MKKASTATPNVSRLPWERVEGAAAGTGICLSGGGLRAASFSFGVLQALQEKHGMVYGPTSVQYLAAVSGGSYIAATYLLGAHHRVLHPEEYGGIPLLAEGSPEEAHILSNGCYLARAPFSFILLGVLNFLNLVSIFVWIGMMLAVFAIIHKLVAESSFGKQWLGGFLNLLNGLHILVPVAAVLVLWFVMVRNLYAESFWQRHLFGTLCLYALFVPWQPVLQAAASRPHWWSGGDFLSVCALLVAFTLIVAGVTLLARRIGITGLLARWLNTIALFSSRLLGMTLIAFISVWSYWLLLEPARRERATRADVYMLVLYFACLIAPILFSYAIRRASLHRIYRCRLESCFSVRREGGAAVQVACTLLTELTPPQDASTRFPRLLVCATANVRRGRSTFEPFILSHDVCGVPGFPEAVFPTDKLEFLRDLAGLRTRQTEPLVSLFTAVAVTGAALSPSMGRYTLPSIRLLLTAANIRLGRWFPNPFSARGRKAVVALTSPVKFDRVVANDNRFKLGIDNVILEVLGYDGIRMYVSDGGHYDNLGLLALLRAKCAEVWCVDASPEPRGQAEELHRVLAFAREEMGIEVDIDLDCFVATPDSFYRSTHAAGSITYSDGSNGRLIVIKLGLTRESPNLLRQQRHTDRGFPHHSTLRQVYSSDRMDAYRKLGYDSAQRCLSSHTPSSS